MLDDTPKLADDDGARELAPKQHHMWISEMLLAAHVTSKMNAFKEET